MGDRRVLKATIWYTISNFILKGIGLITTPVFTRILTREEYGAYTNYVTWYSVISIIATLSLVSALVRARFDYEDSLNSFVLSNLLLGSAATLFISALLWINKGFFCDLFVLEEKYLLIMCLSILVSPAYDMFLCTQRFQYKYKLVAMLSIFTSVSSVLLSLFLIYTMEDKLFARTVGTYLPSFVVAIVLYIFFFAKGKSVRWEYCRYSLIIAVPYLFHLMSGTILNSSDKAVITKLSGPSENALYSLAYSVGLIVNVIWTAVNSAFTPWLGEKLNEKKYSVIKKYAYGYVLLFAVGVVGLMLLAPEVLMILGGSSYFEARYAVPPIMAGYYFLFIYSMYVNIEQFEKKTIPMAIATCVAALLNIISNVVFVKQYGYIAAAYTTMVCYILLSVFHYGLVRRMKMHFVYDTRFLTGVSCFVGMFVVGSLFLYNYSELRYAAIVFYMVISGAVMWKKRGVVMGILCGKNKGLKHSFMSGESKEEL